VARRSRALQGVIAVVAVVAVAAVAGPFVYIHFIEGPAPKPLSLDTSASTPTDAPAAPPGAPSAPGPFVLAGTWAPTSASQLGYRVNEVLLGQSATAVGRTNQVTGSLTITGTDVTAATFTVDMGSVSSDKSQRDDQFRGRVMDTADHPTATFTLTGPIHLGSEPGDRQQVSATAAGDLTLRGVTRAVTFALKAQRNGSAIEVNGSIPIAFADWGIPNPSFGPVTTEDHGVLEFLLVFAHR